MYLAEFLTIAIAHLFAVASPGPDFALVLRQSISFGQRAGLWTSAGIATGILIHVAYCLLGVAVLLASSDALFNTMKLLAATYLMYLGTSAIRQSLVPQTVRVEAFQATRVSARQLFITGFITNGLNPKATLFFLALFTVVINQSTPVQVQMFYGFYLSLATFVWFAGLSSVLGREPVRRRLLQSGVWFERGMGVVLILLAIQLAFSMLPD